MTRMNDSDSLGMNKTGLDMAPKIAPAMLENQDIEIKVLTGPGPLATKERHRYVLKNETLGTTPVPATVKGIAKTALKKLEGVRIELFVNKLGERLAFERAGCRLYDLLISKLEAFDDLPDGLLASLRENQRGEMHHVELLRQAFKELGADETAVTPAADAMGVASSGLFQVASDPRIGVKESLQAILIAELTDNDAWLLLVDLANEMGLESVRETFEDALIEEERHLEVIRSWVDALHKTAPEPFAELSDDDRFREAT